jgi:hypothetical protein
MQRAIAYNVSTGRHAIVRVLCTLGATAMLLSLGCGGSDDRPAELGDNNPFQQMVYADASADTQAASADSSSTVDDSSTTIGAGGNHDAQVVGTDVDSAATDVRLPDSSESGAAEAGADARPDSADSAPDVGRDAEVEHFDSGKEAAADAPPDVSVADASTDASFDGSADALVDVAPEALPDGCVPHLEDCLNGLDDDCNGLIDCADPACMPVVECVENAPGLALGTTVAASASCPASYDASTATLGQGFVSSNKCEGCTCASNLSCQVTLSSVEASSCQDGGVTQSYVVAPGPACSNNTGAGFNITTGNFRVSQIASATSCAPTGTPTPEKADFPVKAKFCETQQFGGGCAEGHMCVAKTTTKHCALGSPATVCPGSYAPESGGTWYTGINDLRSCGTSCSCEVSGGACGTASVSAFLDKACTGASSTLLPGQDYCAQAIVPSSAKLVLQNGTAPTCNVTNTSTGTATAVGAKKLCCLDSDR